MTRDVRPCHGALDEALDVGDDVDHVLADLGRDAGVQGLTLVHFSAQPEPFLTQNTP